MNEEVVTSKVLTKNKVWMQDMLKENAAKAERPTVEQDCEKCDNKNMYFNARQTRGVDEGQTVYYECTKCGHTTSQNT